MPYDVKNNQRPLLGADPVSTERKISRMCKPKRFRIPSYLRTETYLEEVYMWQLSWMFLLLLAVSLWAVEYVMAVMVDDETKAKAGERNPKKYQLDK